MSTEPMKRRNFIKTAVAAVLGLLWPWKKARHPFEGAVLVLGDEVRVITGVQTSAGHIELTTRSLNCCSPAILEDRAENPP